MKQFAEKNKDWIHQVGCDILGWKKLNFDDYFDTVLKLCVPWDELVLLMFARMYQIHFF